MRIWYKLTVQIGHDAHAELYVAVITTVVLQCAYSRVGIPMVVQVFLIQARRICTLKAIACSVPKILLKSCIEHLL